MEAQKVSKVFRVSKSVIRLLTCLFILSGCETPISLSIPGKENTTVIEGWIENGKPATVVVSKSLSYYTNIGLKEILSAVDTTAIVKISDGVTTEVLERQHTLEHAYTFFMISSLSANPSTLLDSSLLPKLATLRPFAYVGKTIIGVPGKTYSLYVETNGKVYTAQTTIPLTTIQVDSFAFFKRPEPKDTTASLRIFFKDNAAAYDCYRLFLKIDNLDWHYEQIFIGSFDDLTFNGKTDISYELLRSPQANIAITGMSQAMREEYNRHSYKKGDVIHIKSTTTDKPTIDYWFPMQTEIIMGGTPFVTPGTLPTNIKGDNVTGIWSGYHARYDTVKYDASIILYDYR